MVRIGRSVEEMIDRCRVEVQAEADRLRGMGGLTGPDQADSFGERVENALAYIAVNAPLRDSPVPPAFTELRIAVVESLTNRERVREAQASLDRVERRVASFLKQEYPALAGVGLGVDDLMEMARSGFRLREQKWREAREIAGGAKGSLLDRVRSRILAGESEGLRDEADDLNPRNMQASGRAVALMAVEATKERLSGQGVALDPRLPRGSVAVTASALHLMRFAADRSPDLLPKERDALRDLIAREGRDIELASDRGEARRRDDLSGFPGWAAS